jgi:nicotinate dehydrogenase subunit B
MKKENNKIVFSDETTPAMGMPRRDFFKILGGGLIIFFRPWGAIDLLSMPAEQRHSLPSDYNAFLQIGETGMVKCFTGKIEMGQGIITSLAMEMADALNVPFEKVEMVMGDTDLCPWDAGTWGSLTTRAFGPHMLAAAAEARGVLIEMAAEKLGVPASQLEVKDGVILDTADPGKTVTYAELTKGKKIEKYLDVKPLPEDYTRYTIVGKSRNHVDGVVKVTGKAKYTGDLRLPGMLFARLLRPPSHGAKMTSLDYSEAEKVPGTTVLHEGDMVAVLNENYELAESALSKIKASYSFDEKPVSNDNLYEWLVAEDKVADVIGSEGDLEKGEQLCDKVFESEYHDPYVAHSPIETHTALANMEGEKLTVWASTQSPFGLKDTLIRELNMTPDNVRVMTPFVGGGFGGKSPAQQGVEAARLAKKTGKPVMVVWSRDEEFFYDTFHPAGVIKIRSGIDKEGFIKMWDYNIFASGSRGSETTYDVPHVKRTHYTTGRGNPSVHPFSTGAWRAPNNNTNTFAREVQIDIMASAAGIDPLEFRLKNLKDVHITDCLKAVADKFGYTPGKSPSGRGIGVACGADAGAWVAHMAEVEVDRSTGEVRVKRIACAQDMGLCVNPQGATIQMEGCLTMGLGYTFTEEIFFKGGNITDRNFDTYEIPKFSWVPQIETVILDRMDQPPQGGGEPAIIAVGAVIANAIYDATGARLFEMPFTPERVLEALKKV